MPSFEARGSTVEHVECNKLERIRSHAFSDCTSLGSIDLPSAKIIEHRAFGNCEVLTYAKFGQCLESIGEEAFYYSGLERITIPLKRDFFIDNSVFQSCRDLKRVDLLEEGATLQLAEIIEALPLREWKNDMGEVIDSITEILLNTNDDGKGGKARRIEEWIAHVLRKTNYYKAQHRRFLTMIATELAYTAANDIVIDNTLSFLELPSHAIEVVGVYDSDETSFLEQHLRNNALRMGQKVKELQSDNDLLRQENDEKERCNDMLKQRVALLEQQLAALTASSTSEEDEGGISQKGQRVS